MNWSFLNSAILWAIPLSLIPLLLHLLFRKPPKVIAFSDLRFLSKVYERYRPRRRLKEWLILLLRVLAILFLFLFFSRPVLHWGGTAGINDSVAIVILIDASTSMRASNAGLSYWDQSLKLAGQTLRSLRESDRSSVIVYSDRIEYFSGYLTDQHEGLAGSIASLEPTYRNTNIFQPLQIAYRLLSDSGASNKSILILSDMAKNGWPLPDLKTDASIEHFDPEVLILYSQLPGQRGNVAIQNVQVMPDLYAGFLKVQVDVKNTGKNPVSRLPVFLDLNSGKRQSETLIDLGPMQKNTASLNIPLSREPVFSGKAGIRADGLDADNFSFFIQRSPRKIKVLFVEEPAGVAALSGESYYFRQALLSPPSPFEVRTMTLSQVKKSPLSAYHTIVLVNPTEIDSETDQSLESYLKTGGSVLLALGSRAIPSKDGTFLGNPNHFLKRLPCRFREVREVSGLSVVTHPKTDDSELKQFGSEYDWEKIQVNRIVQPIIAPDAHSWILLGDGTPLLIFSEEKRVAVWVSSIDRSWNNLVSKPIFTPLSRRIIQVLSGQKDEKQSEDLVIGETFVKNFPTLLRKDSIRLTSPSGKKVSFRFYQRKLMSSPLEEPGIYTLRYPKGGAFQKTEFAVNIDPDQEENDRSVLTDSEMDSLFPDARKVALHTGHSFINQLLTVLKGKELSRYFLVFAGLFLLCEMVLASKRT